MTAFDLTGKRAFVTGASRGIGRIIAVALAAAGADVAIAARSQDGLAETAREVTDLGRKAFVFPLDVTRQEDVTARGDLAFCPSDWVHGSYVADYHKTTIFETWQGGAYKALRQAHMSNDYRGHEFCGQCPDWESTRWPDEGRSYADMIEEFAGVRVVA